MKLYTTQAPSPYRVKVFISEKGIVLPTEEVSLQEGGTRQPAFLQKNSLAEVPVLELDDGSYLTESLAICRYLEALYPAPPLMGDTPLQVARVEMWTRRMEMYILAPVADIARHSFEFFATKFEQVPEYAQTQKRLLNKRLQWLDESLSDGRTYVCDDEFSVADITGMATLQILGFAGIDIPAQYQHANRWADAVRSRPSAAW
jgi:glutathione S-transferase